MDKLFLLFLAHSLGMWVAFWVYDDARQRYPGRIWAIGWATAVYFLLVQQQLFSHPLIKLRWNRDKNNLVPKYTF